MLISFSNYGTDPRSAGAHGAVSYMSHRDVRKPTAKGPRQWIRRDPAPEILIGDTALIRAAIRAAPGQMKYRSGVLSFAPQDIDVNRFNAGDLALRGAVDMALQLWIDVAFAGVPEAGRPPVFATTHTHTGRLEVNFLTPRWVLRADGHIRSYNPDPPGRASHAIWIAYQDLFNARFGWADPGAPDRHGLVQLPHWRAKLRAELQRTGEGDAPDPRESLAMRVLDEVRAGKVCNRGDVVSWLLKSGEREGFVIHDVQPEHVTIGAPDVSPRERMRLKGRLFSDQFLTPKTILPGAADRQLERNERAAYLATAPDRLQRAWEARAAFNLSRYGLDVWPMHEFCAADWQSAPIARQPRIIPIRHLAHEQTHPKEPSLADPTPILDAYGTPISPPASGSRSEHACPNGATGQENYRPRVADSAARSLDQQFDRVAQALVGSGGAGRIISVLNVRFRTLIPRIAARLSLHRFAHAVPPSLLKTLSETRHAMETLNDSLIRHAEHFKARRAADTDAVRNPRQGAESARQSDHATSPASGGSKQSGRRHNSAPRAGDRGIGRDFGQPADSGDDAERRKAIRGRLFSAHREAARPSGRAPDRSRRTHAKYRVKAGNADRLARCAAAPIGSRADLLKLLLSAGAAADPDSRVHIRIFSGEDAVGFPAQIKAFEVNTAPGSILAVNYLASEIWVFHGSPTSITAMSKCWRKHFGLAGDELINDQDVGWAPE